MFSRQAFAAFQLYDHLLFHNKIGNEYPNLPSSENHLKSSLR